MVRFSNLTATAVALFLSGVEAGPCRPLTTSSDSTAVTTLADATTTILTEPTASTTEADLTESASSIASDTTIASVDVTATTAFAEPTTTAQAESTTTTAAPACDGTQLLGNPGFDDSISDITPWSISGGVLTQDSPQSGVNAVYATPSLVLTSSMLIHSVSGPTPSSMVVIKLAPLSRP